MPRVCWPPQTGLMLRNYHLARALARQAEVSCLSFADDEAALTPDAAQELPPAPAQWCQRVVTVPREGAYTPSKIMRGAIGLKPVTVLNYTTPVMRATLAQMLEAQRFDVVQVETSTLCDYLPIIRAAKHPPLAVCDWHNIDSELMRRYSQQAPLMRRLYALLTAYRIAAFERWTLHNYDAHIACSTRDAQQLQKVAPDARVSVIENGVDVDYYTDAQLARAQSLWEQTLGREKPSAKRLIFVGSMDYHANIDAVTDFARRVWPELRRARPALSFSVVGRNPAPEVLALQEIDGIEVTGTVPDVRPYYAQAAAQIVPLRVGGGSRLKILEAMAAGVPVIATTLGAEGLAVRDGHDIAIADTPEMLGRRLWALLDNAEVRQAQVLAARETVRRQYDWAALGAALAEHHRILCEARRK